MSVNTYTTSDLVNLIKLFGHVPQGNATFTAAKLLALADTELRTAITKLLKASNEGFFQTVVDYEQDDSGVYDVPSDAVASTTYSLQIVNGQAIWPVSRQEVSEMTTTTMPSVGNWAFFIRGNKIHVLPTDFDGVLRVTYERRPSKLVATSAAAQVSSVAGQVVTVASVPSSWINGYSVDLQMAQPQFDVIGTREITDITGTNITLTGDLTGLAEGDFLCLEGQTCVPQVPVEFHSLLAQRVVVRIYRLQGYLDKAKAAEAELARMEADLTAMITPRTQAAPKVINPSWGGRKPGASWARFNPPAGPSDS